MQQSSRMITDTTVPAKTRVRNPADAFDKTVEKQTDNVQTNVSLEPICYFIYAHLHICSKLNNIFFNSIMMH